MNIIKRFIALAITASLINSSVLVADGGHTHQHGQSEKSFSTGPHGGKVSQVGKNWCEVVYKKNGIHAYLYDAKGKKISSKNIRGSVTMTIKGNPKKYNYDLYPDSAVKGEENALFLFDEPETHLNPSWRTHFHQHLSRAMGKNGEPNNRVQLFTSTHSPFLISSLDKQNVYRFERTNEGRVSMLPAATQTFGASFEVLLKRFFELDSLISQTAIDQIRMHIEQGDHAQARLWIEENIGDSMEKAYLLKRLGE